jgi:hypothetical protein
MEDSPGQEPDFNFEFTAMTVSEIASEFIRQNVRFTNMTQ